MPRVILGLYQLNYSFPIIIVFAQQIRAPYFPAADDHGCTMLCKAKRQSPGGLMRKGARKPKLDMCECTYNFIINAIFVVKIHTVTDLIENNRPKQL